MKINFFLVIFVVLFSIVGMSNAVSAYENYYFTVCPDGKGACIIKPENGSGSDATSFSIAYQYTSNLPSCFDNAHPFEHFKCKGFFSKTQKRPPDELLHKLESEESLVIYNRGKGYWELQPDYRMKFLFSKATGNKVVTPLIKHEGRQEKFDSSINPCVDDIIVKDHNGFDIPYCRVGELPASLTDKEPQAGQKWNYVTKDWYFDDEENMFDDYGLPKGLEITLNEMAKRLDMQEFGDFTIAETGDVPLSDFDLSGNKYQYKLPVGVIVDHVAFFGNAAERWLVPLKLTFKSDKYMISFKKNPFERLARAKASKRSLSMDTSGCFVRWYTYSE